MEVVTILIFSIQKHIKISIDNNIKEYVIIDGLESFELDDQLLNIKQSYALDSGYSVTDEINFTVNYTINFYYYKTDNTIGVVTFYKRLSEVKLIDNNIVIQGFELSPKSDIASFKGILKLEIDYIITSSSGSIERR